jgi:hypothetical protein
VTGDAATAAPTAGSGNVSDVGIALGLRVEAVGDGEVVDKRAETNSEGVFMGCCTSPDMFLGQKPIPFSWAILVKYERHIKFIGAFLV